MARARKHLCGCFLHVTLLSTSSGWLGCVLLLRDRRDCDRSCFWSWASRSLAKAKIHQRNSARPPGVGYAVLQELQWGEASQAAPGGRAGRRGVVAPCGGVCRETGLSPGAPSGCQGSCPQAWLRSHTDFGPEDAVRTRAQTSQDRPVRSSTGGHPLGDHSPRAQAWVQQGQPQGRLRLNHLLGQQHWDSGSSIQ